MSEFTCENDHLMTSNRCDICGGKVSFMDGLSARQLERQEREYDEGEEDIKCHLREKR